MRSASRLRFQVVLLDSVHLSTFYSFVRVFMHVNVMLTINFPIIVEECYHRSRLSLALFPWEQARLSDVSVHMWCILYISILQSDQILEVGPAWERG